MNSRRIQNIKKKSCERQEQRNRDVDAVFRGTVSQDTKLFVDNGKKKFF